MMFLAQVIMLVAAGVCSYTAFQFAYHRDREVQTALEFIAKRFGKSPSDQWSAELACTIIFWLHLIAAAIGWITLIGAWSGSGA